MDEQEFRSLLDLFPIVRSRDYRADLDAVRPSTSRSVQDNEEWHDARNDGDKSQGSLQDEFWQKLKMAAERKVSAAEAERFCKAFQQIHKKLVFEELNLDAAKRIVNS